MTDKEEKCKIMMDKTRVLGFEFTENSRSRIVFDLLRILRTHPSYSKSKFMNRLSHLLNAQTLSGQNVEYVLSELHSAEGDEFAELASAFVGGLLLLKVKP